MQTEDAANYLLKKHLRLPCTNFAIATVSSEKKTIQGVPVRAGHIVFPSDIYTSDVPAAPPALCTHYTADNAGSAGLTARQSSANHWKALLAREAAGVSTSTDGCLVYVNQLQLRYVAGCLGQTFHHPALEDCIQLPGYEILVETDGQAVDSQAMAACLIQSDSGLLQFHKHGNVPALSFTADVCPCVSFWRYVGPKGFCTSVLYDHVSGRTSIEGTADMNSAVIQQTLNVRDLQCDHHFRVAGSTDLQQDCTLNNMLVRGLSCLRGPVTCSDTISGTTVSASVALQAPSLQVRSASVSSTLSAGDVHGSSLHIDNNVTINGCMALRGGIESLNVHSALTAESLEVKSIRATSSLETQRLTAERLSVQHLEGLHVPAEYTVLVEGTAEFRKTLTCRGPVVLEGGIRGPATFHGHVGIAAGKSLRVLGQETTGLGGDLEVGGRARFGKGVQGPLAIQGSTVIHGELSVRDNIQLGAGRSLLLNGQICCNAAGLSSDCSTPKGINFWKPSSTEYSIYVQAASEKSYGGRSACAGDGITSYALRSRMPKRLGQGFVWENDHEECLMSLTAQDGSLQVHGPVTITGGLTAKSAAVFLDSVTMKNEQTTFEGAVQAASLTVTKHSTLATLALTGPALLKEVQTELLRCTGEIKAEAGLSVDGPTKLRSVCVSSDSQYGLTVDNGAEIRQLTVLEDTLLAGNVLVSDAARFTVKAGLTSLGGNLTVSGTSTTVNNLAVGGDVTVSGDTTLTGGVSVSNTFTVKKGLACLGGNLTVTGRKTHVQDLSCCGSFSVSGSSVMEDITVLGDLIVQGKLQCAASTASRRQALDHGAGCCTLLPNGIAVSATTWTCPAGFTSCSINTSVIVRRDAKTATEHMLLLCTLRIVQDVGAQQFSLDDTSGSLLTVQSCVGAGALLFDCNDMVPGQSYSLALQVQDAVTGVDLSADELSALDIKFQAGSLNFF
jgi:hypothetical protein